MGNGYSTDLTLIQDFFSACQMSEITEAVQGIPGNSSSPTDTWILKLCDACYLNAEIKRAFIKIHINSSSVGPEMAENKAQLQGLEYEIGMYRDIVRPLVDLDICPHFVRYLAHSTNCSQESLVNILKKDSSLARNASRNFERSIAYMANSIPNRPSVNSDEDSYPQLKIPNSPGWKFNVLATEAVREGSQTLENYLDSHSGDFWNVVFQCLAALHALGCSKVTLNDGHDQNWWVEPPSSGTAQDGLYVYDNFYFFVQNKSKVMCYDYDRAYTKRLGDNTLLNGALCGSFNQCNSFEPCKDLVKLMFYIYCRLKDPLKKSNLLELLCKSQEASAEFQNMCFRESGPFLFKQDGEKMDSKYFSANFFSPLQIMKHMYDTDLVIKFDPALSYGYSIYVCSSTHFDQETGKIFREQLYLQKQSIAEQFFKKHLRISELNTEITRLRSDVYTCAEQLYKNGHNVVKLTKELETLRGQISEGMQMQQ